MKDFGSLKRLDLRTIWSREDFDFTPWLAENLARLGEALGLDLELQSTEAPVGDFAVDILAKDLGQDRLVVIENQLGPTDHDHLGKLLTYASGYDAATIVWVTPEFREEHRQALDWLNQHTDSDTDFFGVVVEALQVDESRPAVNFRLVAAPNEWRKEKVGAAGRGQVSKRGEAYLAFFQPLVDELREKHRLTSAKRAYPQAWFPCPSGIGGIVYSACFVRKGRCRAELYINIGDAAENKRLFDALYEQRQPLESQFGSTLAWERLEDKRACRISLYRDGSVESPAQTHDELRTWFIGKLLQLKLVFGKPLQELAG